MGTADTGPLFLLVTITPDPDRRAEAQAQLDVMRTAALREDGCVFMHLLESADDPRAWVMVEQYRSRAAWDAHMASDHNREGNRILQPLLARPNDLRLYQEK